MKFPAIAAFICMLGLATPACSQSALHNTHWEGDIPSAIKLTVAFHLEQDSTGTLHGTMDSPGQGQFGIRASSVTREGDSVFISLAGMQVQLEGKMEPGGNQITARWKQGGAIVPLLLYKKEYPVAYSKVKTQTPQPPLPYESTDVTYGNAAKTVALAATITKPAGAKANQKYPAIILITGSGPQDRDETIMGHKPFAVLADYLTRRGYLVLRADDRGTGRSTGTYKNATSLDFADDAETSLNYLLQRPDVDTKHIGLLGHSEGGLIAPIVAAHRKEVSFVILLAGPGLPIIEAMADQNQALLEASGYTKESAASYRNLYINLVKAVMEGATDSLALEGGKQAILQWQQIEKPAIVSSLTGIPGNNTPEKFVKPFVSQLRTPWWQFFMPYNPAPVLEKLSAKVLAINGSRDIQVLPNNLPAIEAALKKSAVKKYNIQEIAGLNHLMQECYYCVVGEYGALQESFSPKALDIIGRWLKENVQ